MFLQEISGSKNKSKFPSSPVSAKSKTISGGDSIDLDLPSTSKESSPALSFGTGEHGTNSRATRSESVDHKGIKLPTDQLNFFSGNPFVEKVQGILHFYKEKYVHVNYLILILISILIFIQSVIM